MTAVAKYDWPPHMRMSLACAYLGLTRWTLARAVREGKLAAAGRHGRSLVFSRDALDRYLLGEQTADAKGAVVALHAPVAERPRAASPSTPAIERLRLLRGGGR